MIRKLIGIWYLFQATDWRCFFWKNGQGAILEKNFRGWREQQNSLSKVGIWAGRIIGGPRGAGFFATWTTSDDPEETEESLQLKAEEASKRFDSFALPQCRCRMGMHWLCSVHHTWKN